MRVVASLTTMPDKYSRIVKTLQSLHVQTYKLDAIYLGLPERSVRLKIEYPELPNEISKLCTVIKTNDYGPITKIVAGILMEDDPDTVIITFDDDMYYPPNLVELLVNRHLEYPNSAIGSSGMLLKYNCPMCAITPNEDRLLYRVPKFPVPPEGRRVDSIYGYPGALYVRKFFPRKSRLEKNFLHFALANHNMLMNDDIVISGYLSMHNIERRIFPNMPVVDYAIPDGHNQRLHIESEISYNLDFFFQRMNAAINTSKSYGMYQKTEPMDISETVIGVAGIAAISILILIGIIVYIFMAY